MRCTRFPNSITTFAFAEVAENGAHYMMSNTVMCLIAIGCLLLIIAVKKGGIVMFYSSLVNVATMLISYAGNRVERIRFSINHSNTIHNFYIQG